MTISKKKKRNISLAILHIKTTTNNTLVTFTDVQGNVFASSSSGANGFKGAKKSTPYAAQVAVETVVEKAKYFGIKTISIVIQGIGYQRESALRTAANSEGIVVTSITDISGVPHNGCRPPNRRRV